MIKEILGINSISYKNSLETSLIACAFMALGIYSSPIMSTGNENWNLDDNVRLCYLVVLVVGIFSIFYENLPKLVALKVMKLSCWAFIGIFIYRYIISEYGTFEDLNRMMDHDAFPYMIGMIQTEIHKQLANLSGYFFAHSSWGLIFMEISLLNIIVSTKMRIEENKISIA